MDKKGAYFFCEEADRNELQFFPARIFFFEKSLSFYLSKRKRGFCCTNFYLIILHLTKLLKAV